MESRVESNFEPNLDNISEPNLDTSSDMSMPLAVDFSFTKELVLFANSDLLSGQPRVVDVYNYTSRPRLVLSELIAKKPELLQNKTVIMATECDASGLFSLFSFLPETKMLDLSFCVNLDADTLRGLVRAESLQLLGLLGVRNLPDLRRQLSAEDSDLFFSKAVWLPSALFFSSEPKVDQ